MGTIVSTIRVGQQPTKDERKRMKAEIRAARKMPPVYDSDCPESTPQALAEFAALARARRHRKTKPVVALRVEPDTLEKYKSLGDGYTGIMADVLNYVADNPEILLKARTA